MECKNKQSINWKNIKKNVKNDDVVTTPACTYNVAMATSNTMADILKFSQEMGKQLLKVLALYN